eukprot:s378_g7.t2
MVSVFGSACRIKFPCRWKLHVMSQLLVDDGRFGPRRVLLQLRPVWHIFLPYGLLSILFMLAVQLYGPFLRSMVKCATKTDPTIFTGSAHCGDANLVLSVAQAREGRLVAMKLLVHAFAGPVLALLADSIGRRPVLLLGLAGFTVAFCIFASVAGLPVLHGSQSLMSLSFLVEGCTSAFDVVFLSVLADLAKTTTERVTCFSVLYGMGALGHAIAIYLSAGILRWQLQNYAAVWLAMSIGMACVMLLVLVCVQETLPSAQAKSRPQKLTLPRLMTSTAVQMRYLVSNRFLQIWLTAVLFKSLAAGLGSIYASFTLAAYDWKPGDWQAVTWPFEMISMGSLSFLGPLAGRKRPEVVISFTSVSGILIHLAQIFAPFTPLALVGPHLSAGFLAFARPVSAAYLSSIFPASQQAKVQALAHLVHDFGISISMATFSGPWLFRPHLQGWDAARPFLDEITYKTGCFFGVMKPCGKRHSWSSLQVCRCLALLLLWPLMRAAFLAPPRGSRACVDAGRRQILHAGAWFLLPSPASAVFENALPEVSKFSERRTPGCGYGPNCFSTTGDPEDPQITTLLQPWKIPAKSTPTDAFADLEAVVRSYPPGQQNVDGGGFQVVKAADGYLYGQFESLKKGKVDDDGTVQVRSSGRIGLKADFGSNAKRLNYISEKLREKGWTAPPITKTTHAYYFSMNSGKTKVQCVGIDCPVNYDIWLLLGSILDLLGTLLAALLSTIGNSMKLALVQRMLRTQRLVVKKCSMSSTGAGEDECSRIRVAVRCRPLSVSERNNEVFDICRVMDQRLVILLDPGAASNDYLRHDKSKDRMIGTEQEPGVMSRTVDCLFAEFASDQSVSVVCCFVEVYNEVLRDLGSQDGREGMLDLREDPVTGPSLTGVTELQAGDFTCGVDIGAQSVEDVMKLLQGGNQRRTTEPTAMNVTSSRSHAVFQVRVERRDREATTLGKLSLIDLAGSERASQTHNSGMRLLEGANINRSLLALGNCINALASGSAFVPFRDSKLTRLLKDSLGGNCRTVMIANISPSHLSYEDTLNTLKYANRAKNIRVRQYTHAIADLRQEAALLKAKLVKRAESKSLPDIEEEAGDEKELKEASENWKLEIIKNLEARASLQRSLMEVEKALVQWKAELLQANEVIAYWEDKGPAAWTELVGKDAAELHWVKPSGNYTKPPETIIRTQNAGRVEGFGVPSRREHG